MPQSAPLIALLGPTASGKTHLAVALARAVNGEILSADSRQVYRQMDIGTGKDLTEYTTGGEPVAFHLIDIRDAGERYDLFSYQRDFHLAYQSVIGRNRTPILCGGSGLYAEAILRNYRLVEVPPNRELRKQLSLLSDDELTERLKACTTPHNTTDLDSRQRTIRAIEIALATAQQPISPQKHPSIEEKICFALHLPRDLQRERITRRLELRMAQGLIEEVRGLLSQDIPSETLIYYGLEYRYITQHLLGELSFAQMRSALNTAIHQFAKRQGTYLRGLERRGIPLVWLDATQPTHTLVGTILGHLQKFAPNWQPSTTKEEG